mmetsp:Transcript_13729/g.36767  ORF Transcript_13729/g.36767 Transcript_13729/m.36767 type:complete len:298 (+) Transcript_13729:194-1087(+)
MRHGDMMAHGPWPCRVRPPWRHDGDGPRVGRGRAPVTVPRGTCICAFTSYRAHATQALWRHQAGLVLGGGGPGRRYRCRVVPSGRLRPARCHRRHVLSIRDRFRPASHLPVTQHSERVSLSPAVFCTRRRRSIAKMDQRLRGKSHTMAACLSNLPVVPHFFVLAAFSLLPPPPQTHIEHAEKTRQMRLAPETIVIDISRSMTMALGVARSTFSVPLATALAVSFASPLVARSRSSALTSAGVRSLSWRRPRSRICATTPATWGAAIDVPLMTVSDVICAMSQLLMAAPGASTVTQGP